MSEWNECPELTASYERMFADDFDSWLRTRLLNWRADVEELLADVVAARLDGSSA